MAIIKRDTDYVLRALAHLAGSGDAFVPVSELAEAEAVPEDFLRKIMQTLNHARITESRQGAYGGYRLAQDPADVTLLGVLEAVQGPLAINECFQAPGICERACACPFREQLAGIQDALTRQMAAVTLQKIVDQISPAEQNAR